MVKDLLLIVAFLLIVSNFALDAVSDHANATLWDQSTRIDEQIAGILEGIVERLP